MNQRFAIHPKPEVISDVKSSVINSIGGAWDSAAVKDSNRICADRQVAMEQMEGTGRHA
jgi:hypothetical protein